MPVALLTSSRAVKEEKKNDNEDAAMINICAVALFIAGVVKIIPCENSRTFVNGKLITESTVLRSGKFCNEEINFTV